MQFYDDLVTMDCESCKCDSNCDGLNCTCNANCDE